MDQPVPTASFGGVAPQVESAMVAVDGASGTSPATSPVGQFAPGMNGAPLQPGQLAGPLPSGPVGLGMNGGAGFGGPPMMMQPPIGNFDGASSPQMSTGNFGNPPGMNPSGNFDGISDNFGGNPSSMPNSFGGPPRPTSDQTRYRGTVMVYEQEKGSGMIDSPQVQATYGSNVFFLVGALRGREPHIGMELEFCVIANTQNGPQACNVSFPHPGSSPPLINPGVQPAPGDPAGGRFLGVIKNFNSTKGWGHIESHEARAIFGRDIFLLRSALRGADVGAGNQLEFSVNNAPKGPMARDVCLVDYGPSMPEAERYRANLGPF